MSRNVFILLFLFTLNVLITSQTIVLHSINTDRQKEYDRGYTLNGAHMSDNRSKLLDPSNFGIKGIYPKEVVISDLYSTSGDLVDIINDPPDILFFGSFAKEIYSKETFTPEEINALYNWSLKGGKVIIAEQPFSMSDGHDYQILDDKWNFTMAFQYPTDIIPTNIGLKTKIFSGPFGEISYATQGGSAQGYISNYNPNAVILAKDYNDNATMILDCYTEDIIIADVDAFTHLSAISIGPEIKTMQDRFFINLIAFMDSLEFEEPIVRGDSSMLTTGNFDHYQWLWDNSPIEGANGSTLSPIKKGFYQVVVNNSLGCKDTSDIFAFGDSLAPMLKCGNDLHLYTDTGKNFATFLLDSPVVYDNDKFDITTQGLKEQFPIGSSTVSWKVVDNEGFSDSCQIIVTVQDIEPPIIEKLNMDTIFTVQGENFAYIDLPIPVVSDNDGIDTVFHNAPNRLPIGASRVKWTAIDHSGNERSTYQRIIVLDKEVPGLICPQDTIIYTVPGEPYGLYNITIDATDNDQIKYINNDAPEKIYTGQVEITWTASDLSENIASCSHTIEVIDNEIPSIQCPPDISIDLLAGDENLTIDIGEPIYSDNVMVTEVINNAIEIFPVGQTLVQWKAVDANLNEATCTQIVNVDGHIQKVPNIITPNGDGLNETFFIENLQGVNELIIINNLNGVVYHNKAYQNDWNGTDNDGNLLEKGTYWYILYLNDGRKLNGYVIVNR